MVRGRVWKPKLDGRWHWQLIVKESTAHAHVYSGHEENHPLAMAMMEFAYVQHRNPSYPVDPFRPRIYLGVDGRDIPML